MFSYNFSKLI